MTQSTQNPVYVQSSCMIRNTCTRSNRMSIPVFMQPDGRKPFGTFSPFIMTVTIEMTSQLEDAWKSQSINLYFQHSVPLGGVLPTRHLTSSYPKTAPQTSLSSPRPSQQPDWTEEAKASNYALTVLTPKSAETAKRSEGITFSQVGEAAIDSQMVQDVEDEMKVRMLKLNKRWQWAIGAGFLWFLMLVYLSFRNFSVKNFTMKILVSVLHLFARRPISSDISLICWLYS